MLELSMKNNPTIQYIKNARKRWNANSHGKTRSYHLSQSICGLFWQAVAWATLEVITGVFAVLAIVGAFLFNANLWFGMFAPLVTGDPSFAIVITMMLGLILSFLIYFAIGAAISWLIIQLFKSIPMPEKTKAVKKEASVVKEYVRSYKEKYCPLIRYVDEE